MWVLFIETPQTQLNYNVFSFKIKSSLSSYTKQLGVCTWFFFKDLIVPSRTFILTMFAEAINFQIVKLIHYGACTLSHFSHVWVFVTLWTVAHQAPLSIGFSSQEYWSGLLYPFPGDLPYPGIEPTSLMFLALVGRFFTTSTTWEAWNPRSI